MWNVWAKTWLSNNFARKASGNTAGSLCASLRMMTRTLKRKYDPLSPYCFPQTDLMKKYSYKWLMFKNIKSKNKRTHSKLCLFLIFRYCITNILAPTAIASSLRTEILMSNWVSESLSPPPIKLYRTTLSDNTCTCPYASTCKEICMHHPTIHTSMNKSRKQKLHFSHIISDEKLELRKFFLNRKLFMLLKYNKTFEFDRTDHNGCFAQ